MNCIMVDLETGGLAPEIHGLTEIAAISFSLDMGRNPAVCARAEFSLLVRPEDSLIYTPHALSIQGRTLTELNERGKPEGFVWSEFGKWLNKQDVDIRQPGTFWAQNAHFDHGFLLAADVRQRGDIINPRCDWGCTRALFIALRAMGLHSCRYASLKNITAHYGIPQDASREHNGLYDAQQTMRALNAMMDDLKTRGLA